MWRVWYPYSCRCASLALIYIPGVRRESPKQEENESYLQALLGRQQLHMAKQRADCLKRLKWTAQTLVMRWDVWLSAHNTLFQYMHLAWKALKCIETIKLYFRNVANWNTVYTHFYHFVCDKSRVLTFHLHSTFTHLPCVMLWFKEVRVLLQLWNTLKLAGLTIKTD